MSAPRLTLRHQVVVNTLAFLHVTPIWTGTHDMMVAELRDQVAELRPVTGLPIAEEITEAAVALCSAAAMRGSVNGSEAWWRANLTVGQVLSRFFQWRAAEAWEALRATTAEG